VKPERAFDAQERHELCDLFVELGPTAPTLLEGWTTRDLAAGLPSELLLYLFGRTTVAHVEVSDAPESVAAVHATHFGM
jgi:hypothetical protein